MTGELFGEKIEVMVNGPRREPGVTVETFGQTRRSGHSGEIRDMMAAVQGNDKVSRTFRNAAFDTEIGN
jgi:hypothetical protein